MLKHNRKCVTSPVWERECHPGGLGIVCQSACTMKPTLVYFSSRNITFQCKFVTKLMNETGTLIVRRVQDFSIRFGNCFVIWTCGKCGFSRLLHFDAALLDCLNNVVNFYSYIYQHSTKYIEQ